MSYSSQTSSNQKLKIAEGKMLGLSLNMPFEEFLYTTETIQIKKF